MCIRDGGEMARRSALGGAEADQQFQVIRFPVQERSQLVDVCLLYTSDAADERSSVDLGGRRIIKKKSVDDTGARPHAR